MKHHNKNVAVVGITGGIGSGKTTVSKYFEALSIPVYYADKEAKDLMNRSKVIKRKLTEYFGDNAYKKDVLNKDYLRKAIFNDKTLLAKMNAIVHPKVAAHFKNWLNKQSAPYILKEAAIIFENNLIDQYNFIITVVADKDKRIKRVIKRDGKTKADVLAIINNQLPDSEKIERSDYVIYNNDLKTVQQQVDDIHQSIITKLKYPKA